MADSVEAIVTAKFTQSQVKESDLRRVVAQAITERFNDGQFDECDLNMRDLFLIRESFVRTLKARFHHRIDYPSTQRKERERDRESAGRGVGGDTGSFPVVPVSVGN
jgi:membrane-associated HD superfamily phosphohydrolase